MRYAFLSIILLMVACGSKAEHPPDITKSLGPGTYLMISVKNYGLITTRIHKKEAPQNVGNIIKLTEKGFYNGLTFHRIIPGFVIQGGCPNGDGTGTPGYDINDEISTDLKHLKGTVAMANRGPNTNGCQFYICLEPQPRLDGGYTIIGQVVAGMEIVEKIGAVKTGAMDKPLKPVVMERVWIYLN